MRLIRVRRPALHACILSYSLMLSSSFPLTAAPLTKIAQAAPTGKAGSKVIPRVQSSAPIADKWAVVIGVGKFADPQVPSLKYSAKDAKDFYDYLVDPALGKFENDHVKLLINEDATKVNIMDMLGDSFLPHAANPNDLVVIYLSTHGSPAGADIRGVNYMVAYDTQLRKLFATGLEMKQLLRIIKERVHTNRILLVLDTCYSGAGGDTHKGIFRTNVDSSAMAQGIGSLVITSSGPEQKSWESDELKNSYFTKYLIDALKQSSGNVPVEQAFNTMKTKVQDSVLKDKGEVQSPVMSGSFCGPSLVLSVPTTQTHSAPVTVPMSSDSSSSNGKAVCDLSVYGEKMRTARRLIDANKLWDASHELEGAIKANPDSVEARLVAADVYDEQQRFNEAYESAKKAVLNDEDSALGREKLARAYMRMKNFDEAMRQAQKAVTLDPESSMAYYLMAYINEKFLSRADQAEQLYRKALELNSLNNKAYMGLAGLLLKQGKEDLAEGFVRKAIEADADDSEAHLALAKLKLAKKDLKVAEDELHKAISADPNNPLIHAELGTVLAAGKTRVEDANNEFHKALELGPNVGYCHFSYARFLIDVRQQPDEAEKEFKLALKLDPDLDQARVILADSLLQNKVYDEAYDQYKKALASNPRNVQAQLGIAKIDAVLYQNYPAAETDLKKAIVIDPASFLAYGMLGQLYDKNMGRYAEAKQSYEKAIEINPKYAEGHYNLAMLLLAHIKENSVEQIMDHLKKAAEADSTVAKYHTKIGYMDQAFVKDYAAAQDEYKKALSLSVSDSEAHMRLGLLLVEKLGQRKAGSAELRTAHEQQPEDPEVKAAYDRFGH